MTSLPTKRQEVKTINPRHILLYGLPKCGKSTIGAGLENALHLDTQNGTDFLPVIKWETKKLSDIRNLTKLIKENGNPYDYFIIDTVTDLEDIVLPLAKTLYKKTPMGKNWEGDDVKTLPKGAGYLYLRMAFCTIIDTIESWGSPIIFFAHLKDKMLEKNGEEIAVADIDLSGKLKSILSGKVDAIGRVYRKENKTIIDFAGGDENTVMNARANHIRNKEIVIAESDEKDNITTYWDKIFLPNK